MPRFGDTPDEAIPVHLLLCGDSKSGKSRYVAQAALDGFTILYVDADNGANTIKMVMNEAGASTEVRNRIIHVPCGEGIYNFLKDFTEKAVMRWNLTKDKPYGPNTPLDPLDSTDMIAEIRPALIPKGVIVVFDSWTSVSLAAMRLSAGNKKVKLSEMGALQQAVYGEAGIRLTQALDILQNLKAHTIVQAHGLYYERQERPSGNNTLEEIKQKDMIVKETIQIPLSCSKVHGLGILKYFNEVGWLITDRTGKQMLDFTRRYDRAGGGSVNKAGNPEAEFRFSNLFAKPVSFTEEEIAKWYREYPASEIAPVTPPVQKAPAPQTTLPAAGSIPTAAKTTTPNALAALMVKK